MESMAAVAAESVDVILRDGGTLRLRPPTQSDAAAVLGAKSAHSPTVNEAISDIMVGRVPARLVLMR